MPKSLPLPASLDACAERLEHLNRCFPSLASEVSQAGVMHWREAKIRCLAASDEALQESGPDVSRKALALTLLQENSLEEVLDILHSEHRIECTLAQLVELVGHAAYTAALKVEAKQLAANAISYEQVAGLWNDLGRPALGADRWSGQSVSILVT